MEQNTSSDKNQEKQILLTFQDNKLLPILFGEQDKNLSRIEEKMGVSTASRGNTVAISGKEPAVSQAKEILQGLYGKLEKGHDVTGSDVDAAIRMAGGDNNKSLKSRKEEAKVNYKDIVIKTQKKHITPYSHTQAEYIKALFERELTFGTGPAGTGKTYLAVAVAVAMFIEKKVDRIILSRPAVEAGEKLGFLPGNLMEKVDPYLRPLYDALHDMIPAEKVARAIENAEIEIAPLAFMRGRTLSHSFIILDEAQNATTTQMKMFLTRLGQGSRMAICGDISQTDLPSNVKSGLRDAVNKLKEIPEIGHVRFQHQDCVRNELTTKIVQAYEKYDNKVRTAKSKITNKITEEEDGSK